MFLVDLTFEWYEVAMLFHVFIFTILFRIKFFQKCHSQNYLMTATLKVHSQLLHSTLTKYFERHPTVKDFTDTD